MCGIAGFIGNSNNYKLTYRLISNVFKNLQIRGKDASGFWSSAENQIIFHKQPIKSSSFCLNNEYWKILKNMPVNLLIAHARGASIDYGSPRFNINNHPFLNYNKNIALIHNGKIDKNDYDFLKRFFKLKSECDSELYLKFVENNIINGIQDIWSYLYDSHMAIAIAQHINQNDKNLFLFKNKYRSLWMVDLRYELNQIFFVSTKQIWEKSVEKLNLNNVKFIQVNPNELYHINLKNNNFNINKYDIEIKKKYNIQNIQLKKNNYKKNKFDFITGLKENEF